MDRSFRFALPLQPSRQWSLILAASDGPPAGLSVRTPPDTENTHTRSTIAPHPFPPPDPDTGTQPNGTHPRRRAKHVP